MASPLRNLGAGLLRGTTADVLGMPIDTLNMIRQGLLSPAQGGNPYARSIAGLLGPTQEVGSSDYFAQQMGLPQGEGLLYEGARMVSPSPTDLMSLARRAPIQELITYHGTPHRFEPTPANPLGEFEGAKIGSGEGAQMYGHGIYLAEAPEVAKEYATTLANRDMANQGRLNAHANAQRLAALAGDPEYAADDIRFVLSNEPDHPQKTLLQGTLAFLESGDFAKPLETKGNLYKADLPDEMIDRMLDWNKPLSEQPESVRKALRQAGLYDPKDERNRRNAVARLDEISSEMDALAKDRLMPSNRIKDESRWHALARERDALVEKSVNVTGEELHQRMFHAARKRIGTNKGAQEYQADVSEQLRKLGIPGIKYLDQGSRGAGEGTRNFVVFPGEEKKVKILKRD
jgi:hypothetical protein